MCVATDGLSGGIIGLHLDSCAAPFASYFLFLKQFSVCIFASSHCFFPPQYALCKYHRVILLPSARFLTVYSLLGTQQQTKTNKQKKNCSQKQYLYKHWGLGFFPSFLSFSGIANHDYHEGPLEQPPSGPARVKLF